LIGNLPLFAQNKSHIQLSEPGMVRYLRRNYRIIIPGSADLRAYHLKR